MKRSDIKLHLLRICFLLRWHVTKSNVHLFIRKQILILLKVLSADIVKGNVRWRWGDTLVTRILPTFRVGFVITFSAYFIFLEVFFYSVQHLFFSVCLYLSWTIFSVSTSISKIPLQLIYFSSLFLSSRTSWF